jgi:MoaA/NifB/PqqE/SkfB family radical SAM enzyme
MKALSRPALGWQLFKNGLRFQYLHHTGRPAKPQVVSLEITHQCIAKCMMCNIWRIPREVPMLSTVDWLDLLSSPLFNDLRELDITGGEPFLKQDLPTLLLGTCDLKQRNLSSLKSIIVPTNGFLTERILTITERVLPLCKEQDIEFVVVCSMDAVGETHDQVRNYKGAWQKVDKTIQGLIKIRQRFSNLIIGLKTTILPVNVLQLNDIVRYAEQHDLFTIISPCIITEGRYLNSEQAATLTFRPEHIKEMISFFESDRFQWSYHRNRLIDYLKTGKMKKPCTCGYNYFFVRSTGELFLCPLINPSMGNIRQHRVEDLFTSEAANRMRRRIGKFPECAHCTEPGLERYALPFQGFSYLSLLLSMKRDSFLQLHRHMGMDKYFT